MVRWQVYEMASSWNGKLTKGYVDKMVRRKKSLFDIMVSWQNGKVTKWQGDKMARWQNG